MPFPLPDIDFSSAISCTVNDSTLDFKLEDTPSVSSDDIPCPVKTVSLDFMALFRQSSHIVNRTDESREGQHQPSREEMKTLSKDVISRAFSLPSTKKFQLWQGDFVRLDDWREVFVPASNDDSVVHKDWIQIRHMPRVRDTHIVSRYHPGEQESLETHTRVRRTRAMERLTRTGESGPTGPLGLDDVTLGCSLLIPENFSAYKSTRAPVLVLLNGIEMTGTHTTYQGPVRWWTPVSLQHPRQKRLMTLDSPRK
ncbi:hypothetical protein I302_107330 [Kwoniella bestiolae CBS 10118]|uniref:Uncharacterized protein n=1 Tax=Kwoniella bestiolae CBS 10118 TaxID=1296100 RepID=A0A1B9FYU2_9TREE|nr:hypothetical protein I302_06934 [Kwoniella bestiolae CBS 10118]OCF23948.1 hypothetical protein I302_06934 [Kwoniella bestiolae CBS 10118]